MDQHVTYTIPNATVAPTPISTKKSMKSFASIPSDVQSDDDLMALSERVVMKNMKPFSLKISSGNSNETFNFSVQPFTTEDLARAR